MKQILQLRQMLTRLWLRSFGPRWTVGCLVVLTDSEGRVCFLKHKGRLKPWSLPGGLIEWPESPEAGLLREMAEELNWRACGPLVLRETLVSGSLPMIELIFEASTSVMESDKLLWSLQSSEIDDFCWMTAEELERHDGILARHKSAVLRILRSG